jgi:hypothetical protein
VASVSNAIERVGNAIDRVGNAIERVGTSYITVHLKMKESMFTNTVQKGRMGDDKMVAPVTASCGSVGQNNQHNREASRAQPRAVLVQEGGICRTSQGTEQSNVPSHVKTTWEGGRGKGFYCN